MKFQMSILVFLCVSNAYTQPMLPREQVAVQIGLRGVRAQPTSPTERRVALVIGNGAYKDSPLLNPVNDARDIAVALRGLGFEVIFGENLSQNDTKRIIRAFGGKIRD